MHLSMSAAPLISNIVPTHLQFPPTQSTGIRFSAPKTAKHKHFCPNYTVDTLILHASTNESTTELKSSEVDEVLNQYSDERTKDLNYDVRGMASRLSTSRTAEEVKEILKDEPEIPIHVFSFVITVLGLRKCLDSAIAIVDFLKLRKEETNGAFAPNLLTYNALLGAVKHSKQVEKLHSVLEDMASVGINPDSSTCNCVMRIYIDQGRPNDALKLLQQMKNRGMPLSHSSHSNALLAYFKLGDGFGALSYFVKIRDEYIKAGEEGEGRRLPRLESFMSRICHLVLKRWLRRGDCSEDEVLKFFSDFEGEGLELELWQYSSLISSCQGAEHLGIAEELYKRSKVKHNEMTLAACNRLIWIMGRAENWKGALEVYLKMKEEGPEPSGMSREMICSHFSKQIFETRKRGRWEEGMETVKRMERLGLSPTAKEWDSVLVSCSRSRDTSVAVDVFKAMVEKGVRPTVLSYGAVLTSLEKAGMYEEAVRVWDHMVRVGVRPDLYVYTTMVFLFSSRRRFDLVASIVRSMFSSGTPPTVVTYNAIISSCCRNAMDEPAALWFDHMRSNGIPPNQVTYQQMVRVMVEAGRLERALDMYVTAAGEGKEGSGGGGRRWLEHKATEEDMKKNQQHHSLFCFLFHGACWITVCHEIFGFW